MNYRIIQEYMNRDELGSIIIVDSLKQTIKKIGQTESLNIINRAIAEPQRAVYKKLFFQAVHELEQEA